jgi:hypothetical protein
MNEPSIDIRTNKIKKLMTDYLMGKYGCVSNVDVYSFNYIVSRKLFHFIIDVNYSKSQGIVKLESNRVIRKDVSNFCKYILGENDTIEEIVIMIIKPNNGEQ